MADNNMRGLQAEGHSRWIDRGIAVDDDTKILVEEFLVGTPSCDLSRKGRDLFGFYKYTQVEDYMTLWNALVERVSDTALFKKYQDLGESLLSHDWLGFTNLPKRISEAIYLYISDNERDKLYRRYFSDLPPVENKASNKDRKRAAEQKKTIVQVNQLFYHLRNSLAHGCFSKLKQDNEVFYVFQDENKDHFISARMVLSRSTLMKWIALLKDRKGSIA